MSVKLQIYNDFLSVVANKLPEFKKIGYWNSQIFNEKREIPFKFPAIFLEFRQISWKPQLLSHPQQNINSKVFLQKSESFVVTLHCCFSYLQKEDVSFVDMEPITEKVSAYFTQLQGCIYGPWQRAEERMNVNHDRVFDWEIDFNFLISDFLYPVETFYEAHITGLTINETLLIDNDVIRSASFSGLT